MYCSRINIYYISLLSLGNFLSCLLLKSSLVDLVEILQRVGGGGLNGGGLRLPVSRANLQRNGITLSQYFSISHLSVFLHKLESFDKAKGFIHTSADRQVVD